ncbi:unnamed protein product [Paramecium sonneborni]|uniref:Uncharacterized protein n=1 Tax=Paramecium sonneborni TaxID=65129 RepID=A0A8S1R2Y2_9CILI|nr:unnamed protein product [Paramecium sonneborni]
MKTIDQQRQYNNNYFFKQCQKKTKPLINLTIQGFQMRIIINKNNKQEMILWSLKFLIIQSAFGWRDYKQDFRTVFPDGNDLCPEFHVHMPGLHPHQCVSYASVCNGVTEVQAIFSNNFYYLCHPRFKTENMTKDEISVFCQHPFYLKIELSFTDGLMYYSCEKKREIELCLIHLAYPKDFEIDLGYIYDCQFCKPPYFGRDCLKINPGYDYERSKNSTGV